MAMHWSASSKMYYRYWYYIMLLLCTISLWNIYSYCVNTTHTQVTIRVNQFRSNWLLKCIIQFESNEEAVKDEAVFHLFLGLYSASCIHYISILFLFLVGTTSTYIYSQNSPLHEDDPWAFYVHARTHGYTQIRNTLV